MLAYSEILISAEHIVYELSITREQRCTYEENNAALDPHVNDRWTSCIYHIQKTGMRCTIIPIGIH